jgi:RimJ/RimL family protein N-acetyltransferase
MIAIRPMSLSDAEPLSALATDGSLWEKTALPANVDSLSLREFIKRTADLPWYFTIIVDGEIAGACSLERGNGHYSKLAEFGGWLGKRFHGKHISIEVIRLCTEVARKNGIVRIESRPACDNVAAHIALLRGGFHFEGIREKAFTRENVTLDEWTYAMILEAS